VFINKIHFTHSFPINQRQFKSKLTGQTAGGGGGGGGGADSQTYIYKTRNSLP